ncbi:polysaccharide deacetylase family protein [Halalkalicoccus paucihalophilus]|nr:polysaccharide deacetylase family protein [Halalkalicoccus paucihalophilus]
MVKPSNRRKFLATLGTGSLAFAAGCAGQLSRDTGESDNNGNSDGNGPSDGNDSQQVSPPAINHGEVVSNFDDDLDEWFAVDGNVNADEEMMLTGSRTARIENTGVTAEIARTFPEGLDMTDKHLSLAVQVDTPRPARVTVRVLAPGNADQVWSTRAILSTYTGWLRMDVGYTGQRGEPNFGNVQELRITLDDPNPSQANEDQGEQGNQTNQSNQSGEGNQTNQSNQSGEGNQTNQSNQSGEGNQTNQEEQSEQSDTGIRFWVDDLRTTPAADQGYVMLTFDDTVASQYTNAFPLFEERDMQAVAAVVPGSLNQDDRLSIGNLREMRDAGWDISSHPQGTAFRELEDLDAIQQDIESAYEYLDNRGFSDGARHMFVPYHHATEDIMEITREYHELSSYFGGTPNAVPFTDPLHLSRVNMFDIEGFTSQIDMAAEHNQLAIGLAHGVVPENEIENDPLADTTTQQLETLLDYIEESDVQLVTASELLDNQGSP